MKNLKVSMKLIASFLIVTAMAIAVGVVGIVGMNSLNGAQSKLYESNLLAIEAMGNLRELFGSERNDIRNIFLNEDNPDFDLNSAINKFSDYAKTADHEFSQYENTIEDESLESAYFTAKEAYLGAFADMKTKMFEQLKQGQYDEAYATFMAGGTVISPITTGFASSANMNNDMAKEADEDANSLYFMLTVVLVVVLILAVAVSLFFAFYISGMISKPLTVLTAIMSKAGTSGDITLTKDDAVRLDTLSNVKDEVGQCIDSTYKFVRHLFKIGRSLDSIAKGDLTTDVKVLSDRDTIGTAMQTMVENLNHMFSEIQASTAQVAIGSKQIADGAQSLAQGSTEQAAAVEELSSSISEIAQKTKDNAAMAANAANLGETIKGNAEKGSRQMNEMTQAVREINDASQNISKVIGVIDNIAFQTNILALNAAVEAARAGQHGKGFAVVAEEVRSLASKSADAARETGGMIQNSMEKAALGARIAEETAASLVEIVSGINESSRLVGEIAKSSEEQSEGIAQINKGIDQVAQVIQQNSATAEQSAASSEEMSGQSNMLEELISQFRLKDGGSTLSLGSAKSSSKPRTLEMPEKTSYKPTAAGDYGKY